MITLRGNLFVADKQTSRADVDQKIASWGEDYISTSIADVADIDDDTPAVLSVREITEFRARQVRRSGNTIIQCERYVAASALVDWSNPVKTYMMMIGLDPEDGLSRLADSSDFAAAAVCLHAWKHGLPVSSEDLRRAFTR